MKKITKHTKKRSMSAIYAKLLFIAIIVFIYKMFTNDNGGQYFGMLILAIMLFIPAFGIYLLELDIEERDDNSL